MADLFDLLGLVPDDTSDNAWDTDGDGSWDNQPDTWDDGTDASWLT